MFVKDWIAFPVAGRGARRFGPNGARAEARESNQARVPPSGRLRRSPDRNEVEVPSQIRQRNRSDSTQRIPLKLATTLR
jgi:hypothetical protein